MNDNLENNGNTENVENINLENLVVDFPFSNKIYRKKNKKNNNKKNKKNEIDLDDIVWLREKIPTIKKRYKIDENDFTIPNYKDYKKILEYNYYIPQLKSICKYYNLKQTGNKNELTMRIYNYLYYGNYAIKIQRQVIKYLFKKYKKIKGDGLFNRKICVNDVDFYTLDPLNEISNIQFISIIENKKHYGFDICSLYRLFNKDNKIKSVIEYNLNPFKSILNPFTRAEIPSKYFLKIKKIIRLSKIFNLPLKLEITDEINIPTNKEFIFEQRVFNIFQTMDSLGNYTDTKWFLNLDFNKNVKFFREMQDIWSYRSQLTNEKKREICPPLGNPFYNLNVDVNNVHLLNFEKIRKINCQLMEELINKSTNEQNKSLGVWIVLTGLTLVSNDAAIALPWLYESVN